MVRSLCLVMVLHLPTFIKLPIRRSLFVFNGCDDSDDHNDADDDANHSLLLPMVITRGGYDGTCCHFLSSWRGNFHACFMPGPIQVKKTATKTRIINQFLLSMYMGAAGMLPDRCLDYVTNRLCPTTHWN